MNPAILLAESAGFCMGVSLALSKLNKALEEADQRRIFTFGPIIHNPQVLSFYGEKKVRITEDWNEPEPGDIVLIRAHGVPLEIEDRLVRNNITIIDATCPKVKKAQVLISRNSRDSDGLLLYGESDHPEVKGLLSYSSCRAHLFENIDQLKDLKLDPDSHYCLAAQTTQDKEQFDVIKNYLQNLLIHEPVILDTICDATKNRQVETIEIARQVECMIVVGGKNSGNTRRLCKVAFEHCPSCFHIETESELDHEMVSGFSKFGLTAGASTPDDTISSVYHKLKSILGLDSVSPERAGDISASLEKH
jgi:4-hydroxy-3-methylbut-2-en-1-yl diphosphate reductase